MPDLKTPLVRATLPRRLAAGLLSAAAGALAPQVWATSPQVPEVTGMFTYLADAATITLCADGRQVPVAMEGDYRALEEAYLRLRRQPEEALLVSVEGFVMPRPSAEESQPPRPTLVVKRFRGAWPREACGNRSVDSPLRGTYWRLVRLHDEPVTVAAQQREPHLVLAADQAQVAGSGGCNRLSGSFELDGERLSLGRLAATRRACVDGMEQEQRFLQALEQVQGYRISGSHLELLDAAGKPLLRFEAVAL